MKPEKIAELILLTEKENHLFDLKVGDLQIYPYIRMPLYYQLSSLIGEFSNFVIPSRSKIQWINYIIRAFQLSYINYQKSTYAVNPQILFVGTERIDSILKKNIYLSHIMENTQYNYLVMRSCDNSIKDYISDSLSLFDSPLKIKTTLYRRFIFGDRKKNILEISRQLAQYFGKYFGKSLNLEKFIIKYVKHSIVETSIAKEFLKKINPNILIVQNSYTNSHFVCAAKKLGIPVIELQHSLIYNHHLGYSYPNSKPESIDIFPDYLFTFGDYWNSKASYPIKKGKIISVGFPHYDFVQKINIVRVKSNLKNSKSILIISQNTTGDKLFELAKTLSEKLKGHTIFFKLHPKQYDYYEKNKVSVPDNMNIVNKDSYSLYQLFSICAFQIGVFSTAVFEGLSMGIKTIIYKTSGYEFIKDLIDKDFVKLASDVNEVIDYINEDKFNDSDKNIFFKSLAVENINFEISRILSLNKESR